MNKITKVALIAIIVGLVIGTGFAVSSERITLGKNNATVETLLGTDGKPVTIIDPPAYDTSDFEVYKAERIAHLKETTQKSPNTIVWVTINFKDISTGELEMLKNKYSLKLLGISGAASGTFQNQIGQNATGVAVNVEEMGEKLEWFSKIYYVSAKASLADLDMLSGEPDVILVDLNTDSERHGPVHIPK